MVQFTVEEETEIVFFATERANAKMDDMRSNVSTQQESPSLFIAGNWRKRISCQRASGTIFLCGRKKN